MNFIRTIILGLLIGLTFTLSSCKEDKMTNVLEVIPQDAIFVSSFELKTLSDKANLDPSSETKKKLEKSLMSESKTIQDFAGKLLIDPSKSGLNQLYVYTKMLGLNNLYVAGAMQIENKKDFEKSIDAFVEESKINPVSKGAYQEIASGESVLVFTNSTVVIYLFKSFSGNKDQVIADNFEGKNSILLNTDFLEFNKKKSDITVWFNYKEILANVKYFDTFGSLFKDAYLHVAMNFEKGAIDLTGSISPASKMKEFLETNNFTKEFDNNLLKNFPDKSFALSKIAIKPRPFMEYVLKNVVGQKSRDSIALNEFYNTPETQTVIDALAGDIMISVHGFETGFMPVPLMSGAISLKSDADFDKIINMFPGVSKNEDGYYSISLGMWIAKIHLGYKNDCMYLTNDESAMEAFLEGGFKNNLAASEVGKESTKHDNWIYLNLDLDTYPSILVKLASSQTHGLTDKLGLYESFSYGDNKNNELEVTLKFKDKSRNALNILMNELPSLAQTKGSDFDFDFGDDD